jgi:AraC-like DNA-binding protein
MTPHASRLLAYAVDSAGPMRLTACGIRAPQEPFSQKRRIMSEFVAFMLIKGEISLVDEMPDGAELITLQAGDIHLVAPQVWQASAAPFPPGIVFLWFHFICGPHTPLVAETIDEMIRDQLNREQGAVAQPHWLLPRHLHLGDELDDFTRAHGELQENHRLWGFSDRGTQALGNALIYRLHRSFVVSRQRGNHFAKLSPEAAHVGRARAFIRLHHERPISLAHIAEAVALNPAYLSRCFRRVAGHTVGDALLAARIATAKRLLLEGNSVKAVAHLAGFGSASYFCRQFRRVSKQTPQDFVLATAPAS